ncbi:hypothetical protein L596_024240 [Steinernema carpocapsae]|uniref:aralkylamine N-acetyltransferase n=1 Tax=Steinernema carpocapsae TaxID=34508 RepID=A0A4U5MG47_STECR|nr:hypothetical protein L596_024240 [Steinernema carpocapsae]
MERRAVLMADNEIEYRLATVDDFDAVYEFTKVHFYQDEPVCRNMFDSAELLMDFFKDVLIKALESNLSALALNKTTGELVGYRIVSVAQRNEEHKSHEKENDENASRALNPGVTVFLEAIGEMKEHMWDYLPADVNKIIRREISCVKHAYQKRGIGKKLVKVFFEDEELKELGFDGIVSETSSIANQTLLGKNGFVPLKEVVYADYVAKDGSKAPKVLDDGTTKLVLNFKRL